MTYIVKKQGHKSWADLLGKHISFSWSDGWEEYSPDMVLYGVWMPDSEEQDDSRYPMYYVTEDGGGGYGIRESAIIEVTVHEDKPKRRRKPKKVDRAEQEPRARGGVDDWLREHTRLGSDGLDEIVTLSMTREEAKALEKSLEATLAKLRDRLTQGDESATLEE